MPDTPAPDELDPLIARKLWRTLEPYHAMIYFTPRAGAAYGDLGVIGRSGYFASRVAPMGAVSPAVVVATFFNFDPVLVEGAMAGVWATVTPADLLAARLAAADRALLDALGPEVLASPEMVEAAELARLATGACPSEGRPLFAATAAIDWPDEPHLVLWHATTLLREFRGDGHLAALVLAGLDGCEALITHAASGEISRAMLQTTRGWSDAHWEASLARLRSRGLIESASEAFTDAGRAIRDQIEHNTDRAALAPWASIGPEACDRLRGLVRPWSKAIVAGGAFLSAPST